MVEVMALERPCVSTASLRYCCRESRKLAEERGRSAEEARDRLSSGHAIDLLSIGQLNERQGCAEDHRSCVDTLTGGTLPGAQTGGMGPGLMLRMVVGMGDRRHGEQPVHEHETRQQ